MHTDTISDFLTRIRNAIKAKIKTVDIPASKAKKAIAEIMKTSGFISDYEVTPGLGQQGILRLKLKYTRGASPIICIQRVSRPGLRKYFSADRIPEILNGLGISIVSTSKGIMTNKEAKKSRLGGEVLCYMY